ncbi:MAG: peptidase S41 [Bacteroidetes bacterium CG18_big_fil_WC_8_21_14_2_50_41_14]|nr:MAG: peptidase S41 [Bacteroidetes bacterium CG18_big_fil_WC_8_21_14_2_50_41_14]
MSMNKFYKYLPLVFASILIIGIWAGTMLPQNNNPNNPLFPAASPGYNKVSDILDYIVHDYVDSVELETIQTDAIKGMLEDLDPHSAYITAEEFHQVNDPLLGSFEGIGISFRIEKDTITVINPIPGGPSEKVGLMAGDRIINVNDSLVAGIGVTNNDAMRQLKGKKSTLVNLTIFRRGIPKLLHFAITRDVIPTYSLDVAYMVNATTGYVKLNTFSATTFEEFNLAVDRLRNDGMTNLILDLRGNPGGYLQAAIDIADEFLSDGQLIVYTEGKNRNRRYAYATKSGSLENSRVAILIDEGSASASEIVTGALQDNDKGLIIGRRSFGKGLVQEQMSLPDGSALRLTVARYYTPTGRCIQKPYAKDEDFNDYYSEAFHRYTTGEMLNADSVQLNDSLRYVTPGGKVVYGGGGIMPDIYVPLITDTLQTYYNLLANKGLIFTFAFDYTDKHRPELNRFTDFESFNHGFNMDDNTYRELVLYAEEKGIMEKSGQVALSKNKIKTLFKAYIGRNVLDEKGFYPIFHQIDTTFNRAVYELNKVN